MQKALRLMNLNLDAVVTDITGATGTKIIQAILDGERNAQTLAGLRDLALVIDFERWYLRLQILR